MSQSKQFNIAPYCIYHYSDTQTNTFYGYIGNSTKTITSSRDIQLKCLQHKSQSDNWILYNSFYAFSPMIRPIPNGLKLINAITLDTPPYYTKNIEYGYDPFDVQQNSVSFITWTQPVYQSVQLYIHITPSNHTFPSFEKDPPVKEPGWTQLSPIFVLVDPESSGINTDSNGNKIEPFSKDKNGLPIIKFVIRDNRCMPSHQGMSLEKCFLLTDEDLLSTGLYKSRTLLQEIKKINDLTEYKQPIKNFFSKLSSFTISLVIVIFLISLVLCVILLSR